MTASFEVSDGVTQMIRDHLVCPSDIAKRVGVTNQAVSLWAERYPEFAALIVASPGGPLWWWPQVEEFLAAEGLPSWTRAKGQKRRRRREALTPV